MLLTNFHEFLGFEKLTSEDQKYGIWDGEEFIFVDWPTMSPINLFPRYGSDPYNFLRYLKIM